MISLFLTQFRSYIIGVAVIAVLGFCAYKVHQYGKYEQKIGYDKATAEYTQYKLAEAKAQAAEQARLNKLIDEAQHAANARDIEIKELRSNLDVTSNKLRDAIVARKRSMLTASPASVLETATTGLDLLGDCQAKYADLAEKADRHVSDIKMLLDSWPK